jgi:hypothetical protein
MTDDMLKNLEQLLKQKKWIKRNKLLAYLIDKKVNLS